MAEAKFPHIPCYKRVIVATKGLPCTCKSVIAREIGKWASCQVLYVDDFLSAFSLDKGYNSSRMPSEEEGERLHRLASDALCTSACRHLAHHDYWCGGCVVIKSRLCSTFELDRLLCLPTELPHDVDNMITIIIIIECHVKNEPRLYDRLERIGDKEWYKARSRLDFEKARDEDCSDPAARDHWDLHLSSLLNNNAHHEEHPVRVIRLVLDPFHHLLLYGNGMGSLTPAFRDAIRYLLTTHIDTEEEEVDWKQDRIKDRYEVVQFDKLRRHLAKQELKCADQYYSQQKRKYLCPTSSDSLGGVERLCCVFKTYTPTKHHQDDAPDDVCNCGVCEKRVLASPEGATYTCHFCFLTLHKSCAEYMGDVSFPYDFTSNPWLKYYPRLCEYYTTRISVCKSCKEGGKPFSGECNACLFQTHLKSRRFPTIIKHNSHPQHLLSLQVGRSAWSSNCNTCGDFVVGKYGCYVCGLYYCVRCVLRPEKLGHTHGGHHHALQLVYTRDKMEPEEDYWCGVCSKDMDPDYWFYSCQDCPFYEAHPECIMPSES